MQVPVLATPRLMLRPYRLDDTEEVFTRLTGSEAIASYLQSPAHVSPTCTRAWISQIILHSDDPTLAYWLVETNDTHRIIGSFSLTYMPQYDMYALGFIIAVDEWGHGYATEAAQAVVAHAFNSLGLSALLGFHKLGNPASGTVLRKAGFLYWQDINIGNSLPMPAYLCQHPKIRQ